MSHLKLHVTLHTWQSSHFTPHPSQSTLSKVPPWLQDVSVSRPHCRAHKLRAALGRTAAELAYVRTIFRSKIQSRNELTHDTDIIICLWQSLKVMPLLHEYHHMSACITTWARCHSFTSCLVIIPFFGNFHETSFSRTLLKSMFVQKISKSNPRITCQPASMQGQKHLKWVRTRIRWTPFENVHDKTTMNECN